MTGQARVLDSKSLCIARSRFCCAPSMLAVKFWTLGCCLILAVLHAGFGVSFKLEKQFCCQFCHLCSRLLQAPVECLQELFGPLSMRALEDDRYVRQTEGYLPKANVAFVDEIFKANSAILNTLLTVLNERLFDNGTKRELVPLLCLVNTILSCRLHQLSMHKQFLHSLLTPLQGHICCHSNMQCPQCPD